MVRLADLPDLRERVRGWVHECGGASTVEEAEELAVALQREVGQVAAEEAVAELGQQASYDGCSIACGCGRRARFKGYQKRSISTLCGVVPVRRAYYYCQHCHSGYTPWDERQGLNDRLWTPGVKALVSEVAARLPYGESVELLERMLGLRVEESSSEALVAEVGQRLRHAEQVRLERYQQGGLPPLLAQAPSRLYIGLDGTSAHIDGAWHEVKNAVIYQGVPGAEGIDELFAPRYVAAQEDCQLFGWRAYAAAAAAGVEQALETIMLGDGAEWIWHLRAQHYPAATEILDYFHACEHVHALAREYYGQDNAQGQRWAGERCRKLKAQGPEGLLRALKRMKPSTPEQAEAIRRESGYFARNASRMQYPEFRRRGLMIGSGPVEAACKVVVGHRLKRAGMRWSGPGADAVLAVRTAVLNKDYDQIRLLSRAA